MVTLSMTDTLPKKKTHQTNLFPTLRISLKRKLDAAPKNEFSDEISLKTPSANPKPEPCPPSNKLTLRIDLKKAQLSLKLPSSNDIPSHDGTHRLSYNGYHDYRAYTSPSSPRKKFYLNIDKHLHSKKHSFHQHPPPPAQNLLKIKPPYSRTTTSIPPKLRPRATFKYYGQSTSSTCSSPISYDGYSSSYDNFHTPKSPPQNVDSVVSSTPVNNKRKRTWNKKRDPHKIYKRIVSALKQRDHYGFFLKPVNTSIFVDYTHIIKEPMDLGKMYEKASNKSYTSIDNLKSDLELLVSNAKTYNPKDSAYYKSANRLWEWGLKHINRFADSFDEISASPVVPTTEVPVTPQLARVNVKRRRKLLQELEHKVERLRTPYYTLKPPEKYTPPKLFDTFSLFISKHYASFNNLSQFPPTIPDPNFHSYSNVPNYIKHTTDFNIVSPLITDVLGGQLGLVYVGSLEKFTKNLTGLVRDECWKRINYCTKGCYNLIQKSVELLHNDTQLGVSLIQGTGITDTEYGRFDIAYFLGQLYSQNLEPLRLEQIDDFKINGIDVLPLMNPILENIPPSEANAEIKSLPHDKLLQKNLLDIVSFINSTTIDSNYINSNVSNPDELMERIRRRLLILVKRLSVSSSQNTFLW